MLICPLCLLAVPNISLSVLKPHFLEILLESHIVMIRVRKKRCQSVCDSRMCFIIRHVLMETLSFF